MRNLSNCWIIIIITIIIESANKNDLNNII
jgi:hypothetical protein